MNFKSTFRVIFESREHYRLMNENQTLYPAKLAGKLRLQDSLPVVGDWVSGELQPGDWVLIEELFERRSVLQRQDPRWPAPQILAANVDLLLIVTSANQDLNLNRLDRYVILARSGNVRPLILVNKMELAEDPPSLLNAVASRFPDVDVMGVSALNGWNLDCLQELVQPGQTVALVGSSGVGKSTLCNFLLGNEQMQTQAIREADDRGRHTTTTRELHVTSQGAFVIDTPGIRLVGLSEDAELESGFSDIESRLLACKFTDCLHQSEPGCAVRAALESGVLDIERWENYRKLEKELAHEKRKASKALQAQEKQRWAKISQNLRQKTKLKGRLR